MLISANWRLKPKVRAGIDPSHIDDYNEEDYLPLGGRGIKRYVYFTFLIRLKYCLIHIRVSLAEVVLESYKANVLIRTYLRSKVSDYPITIKSNFIRLVICLRQVKLQEIFCQKDGKIGSCANNIYDVQCLYWIIQ